MKARFSTCSCNDGAKGRETVAQAGQETGLCPRGAGDRQTALLRRGKGPKSDCRLATSRACARTIGPRIRISRPGDASVRCSASNRPDQLALPVCSRRRAKHFQRPTPSHVSSITPRATHCGDEHMARGRRGSLKFRRVENLRALQRDSALQTSCASHLTTRQASWGPLAWAFRRGLGCDQNRT